MAASVSAPPLPTPPKAALSSKQLFLPGRFQGWLVRYAEGSAPFAFSLLPDEEATSPVPRGFWARLRHWSERVAVGELGANDT